MRAGTPSDPALWSLVLLTCVAVPASSSGRQFGGHEHHEDRGGRRIDHERFGAHRNGISQKLLVDNINTVDSWLANASFAADPALRWPGPVRELNRAHVEATRDPIMRWMVPHVRRDRPLVRAVPHGGKHGGALGTRYQPQRRCESASVIDELTAPIFIAAERPRKLTSEGAPFGMRMGGKSEEDMVSSIRRYVANSSQPRQCRFRTCAVVGSSGALRGTHHGASIDAHAAVIRINAAPTHEHEAAVGRRTTWRVHNSEKPYMLAANDVPELQLVICHMAWLGSCQHQAFSGAYGTTIAYINPRFYSQLFGLLGRPHDKQSPSTGLLAIAIALGTCERVTLYGFGAGGGKANKRCRHYWECTDWEDERKYYDPLHTFHDWQAEERLRELWLEAGLVSLGTEAGATEAAGGPTDDDDVGARNVSEAVRRWGTVRKQWVRDLKALQRARQARRQQGHKAGDGRDLVTTAELLHRFGQAAGGGGGGDIGGSVGDGGGGMPATTGGGTRARLKGGNQRQSGAIRGNQRSRLMGGKKGGRGDRSVGEVFQIREADMKAGSVAGWVPRRDSGRSSLFGSGSARPARASAATARASRLLGRTATGDNATAAESKQRISLGKIKKVMRHWTSAGPSEAGG